MINIIKLKKNILNIILLSLLAALLVIDPFLHEGIFRSHDMPSNLANFGGFYDSLLEGNFFPRWLGNVANLYGSPAMIFYYPFSYYLASAIRILGFSLIDTIKIFILITFIFSVLIMYIWLRKHTSTVAALIGSFLYAYAPYRITDIYARGSVAENTAFIFIPLIGYQLYLICDNPNIKRIILLSIALSSLILSHLFFVVIFAPFFLIYLFYLKPNRKKVIMILISLVLAFSLTTFYTVPLIVETKYTHYDISPFNGSEYYTQFLNFERLFLPIWTFIDKNGNKEYQTFQIGLLQISLVLISLLVFVVKSKHISIKIKQFYFIGLFSLIFPIENAEPRETHKSSLPWEITGPI